MFLPLRLGDDFFMMLVISFWHFLKVDKSWVGITVVLISYRDDNDTLTPVRLWLGCRSRWREGNLTSSTSLDLRHGCDDQRVVMMIFTRCYIWRPKVLEFASLEHQGDAFRQRGSDHPSCWTRRAKNLRLKRRCWRWYYIRMLQDRIYCLWKRWSCKRGRRGGDWTLHWNTHKMCIELTTNLVRYYDRKCLLPLLRMRFILQIAVLQWLIYEHTMLYNFFSISQDVFCCLW